MFFRKEDPRNINNQMNVKHKSNNRKLCSYVRILGLMTGSPMELDSSTSLDLLSLAYTTCLINSDHLHSTFVLSNCAMIRAPSKCCDLSWIWPTPSSITSARHFSWTLIMPHGGKSQFLSWSFNLGAFFLTEDVSLLISHDISHQLLKMAPSCFQSQYHLENSYTLSSLAPECGTFLVSPRPQLLYDDPLETCQKNVLLKW